MGMEPEKSLLHKTISAIRADTWEAVNKMLLASARQERLESGKVVRVDSTVTAALIHEPSDSSLLWDCVRVMVRLLQQADSLGSTIPWHDHCRAAKKRARVIEYTRGRPKRLQHYRALLRIARNTLDYLQQAAAQLPLTAGPAGKLWQAQLRHYQPLITQIIAQTERRVLAGEAVPAGEKLVSLFEPHADIIVKGSRDVDYGHKLNLTTGRSGLILDLVIEAGNPADSERLLPLLERHIAFYGEAPRQAAADGGYASRENLRQAKAWGVRDMAFHKKSGLRIEDMVRSRWVYRKLRNFRAGIEAGISCLKRTWPAAPGLDHLRPTSGPRWSPTISPSSPASGRPDVGHRAAFREQAASTGRCPTTYRRQIALRPQPASPVPSRLPKKTASASKAKTLKNRRLWTGTSLRPVEIYLEFMTAAARWMMALKLWSVLSARMAMRLNSLSLQKKFSMR